MSAAKKELLIEYELKFLEKKLKELKKYISARPFSGLEDRTCIVSEVETKAGPKVTHKIVATIEVQRRDLTAALKDYAEIVRTVDQMRSQEDKKKKVAVRGGEVLGSQAKAFLDNRK